MAVPPEALLEQALALAPKDRAKIASGLLLSLDDGGADADDVERFWSEETQRRMGQIASGEARTYSRDEIRSEFVALRSQRSA